MRNLRRVVEYTRINCLREYFLERWLHHVITLIVDFSPIQRIEEGMLLNLICICRARTESAIRVTI